MNMNYIPIWEIPLRFFVSIGLTISSQFEAVNYDFLVFTIAVGLVNLCLVSFYSRAAKNFYIWKSLLQGDLVECDIAKVTTTFLRRSNVISALY